MATKKPVVPEPDVPEDVAPVEIPATGAGTFAERRAARLKAVQVGENKAVQRSEAK